MVILIGKTASGKDTILNNLVTRHGYKKIITYTTRPMRDGEKQDVTYHFVDKSKFRRLIEQNFFIEWKTYKTVEGNWYYGTSLKDLESADNKTIIILTPDGYRDVVDKLINKPVSIYVHADNLTIKNRLTKRGDDPKEAERRLIHDNEDFKGLENEINKIVYNNEGDNIDDVVDEIFNFLQNGEG